MVEAAARPQAPGLRRLLLWFALAGGGAALWLMAVAAAFGLPLSGGVLAGTVPVPDLARGLYVAGLYALLMGTAYAVWRLDAARPAIAFSAARCLAGWAIGLGGLAVLTGVELALGLATPAPGGRFDAGGLAAALAVATAFGISEEALFRGFMLGLLGRSLPARGAAWASGGIFAALHFLRPVDPIAVAIPFAGLWVAGALLAACRLRTGTIWLGVGLHSAWIWFLTAQSQQGWLAFPPSGSVWTGGGNPVAGLLGLAGLGLTYFWVKKRYPCASS